MILDSFEGLKVLFLGNEPGATEQDDDGLTGPESYCDHHEDYDNDNEEDDMTKKATTQNNEDRINQKPQHLDLNRDSFDILTQSVGNLAENSFTKAQERPYFQTLDAGLTDPAKAHDVLNAVLDQAYCERQMATTVFFLLQSIMRQATWNVANQLRRLKLNQPTTPVFQPTEGESNFQDGNDDHVDSDLTPSQRLMTGLEYLFIILDDKLAGYVMADKHDWEATPKDEEFSFPFELSYNSRPYERPTHPGSITTEVVYEPIKDIEDAIAYEDEKRERATKSKRMAAGSGLDKLRRMRAGQKVDAPEDEADTDETKAA